MKLRILLLFACVLSSATVRSVPCRAQSEVDPDHFDTTSAQPAVQPKDTGTAIEHAELRGTFTLPFSVTCAGVSLQPGTYSVVVRSSRERATITLMPRGTNAAKVQVLVISRSRAEGPSSLILEHMGQHRKLTAIKLERPGITLHLRSEQRNGDSPGTELVPIHMMLKGDRP